MLASAGGAAGLLLARSASSAGATLLADQLPRADEISIDGRVLAVRRWPRRSLTGILAGALPALRAGRADLNDALKEGGRNDSAVGVRTRRLLIVCEVALSLVLLMGAGVMLRSLLALRDVDAGFDPQQRADDARRRCRKRATTTPAQLTAFFDTRAASAFARCRRAGGRRDRRSAVAGRIGAADRARGPRRAAAARSADGRGAQDHAGLPAAR